jgi:hypothetical protein
MAKKTSKTSPPLIAAILLVLGFGAWYTTRVISPSPAQPLAINELSVSSSGTATLEASPAPTNQYLGQEFTLDLNAHSGADKVKYVKLNLVYDDTKLEIKSLTKTDYLSQVVEAPVIGNDQVTATYAVPEGNDGKADWGTVAKIVIKPLAVGKHIINFTDGTTVKTELLPDGGLKEVKPIEITIFHVGDIDQDKIVSLLDYNLFVTDYDKSGFSRADLDKSGQVNLNDYKLFVANYGRSY